MDLIGFDLICKVTFYNFIHVKSQCKSTVMTGYRLSSSDFSSPGLQLILKPRESHRSLLIWIPRPSKGEPHVQTPGICITTSCTWRADCVSSQNKTNTSPVKSFFFFLSIIVLSCKQSARFAVLFSRTIVNKVGLHHNQKTENSIVNLSSRLTFATLVVCLVYQMFMVTFPRCCQTGSLTG